MNEVDKNRKYYHYDSSKSNDANIQISSNGKLRLTADQLYEMNMAIMEAESVLHNMLKNK